MMLGFLFYVNCFDWDRLEITFSWDGNPVQRRRIDGGKKKKDLDGNVLNVDKYGNPAPCCIVWDEYGRNDMQRMSLATWQQVLTIVANSLMQGLAGDFRLPD